MITWVHPPPLVLTEEVSVDRNFLGGAVDSMAYMLAHPITYHVLGVSHREGIGMSAYWVELSSLDQARASFSLSTLIGPPRMLAGCDFTQMPATRS